MRFIPRWFDKFKDKPKTVELAIVHAERVPSPTTAKATSVPYPLRKSRTRRKTELAKESRIITRSS